MTVAAPSANGTRTTSRPSAPRPGQRLPSALELIRSSDRSEALPPSAPEPASAAISFQPPGFSPEQLAALSAPLDRANVCQREQGRSRVSYLEGWLAIRLKALADPMRLQLLAHLLRRPEGEDCTCNLAPLVNLSEPTVSHHLKRLESAGLLIKQRRGSSVYYRVVPEAITAIAQVLHVGR